MSEVICTIISSLKQYAHQNQKFVFLASLKRIWFLTILFLFFSIKAQALMSWEDLSRSLDIANYIDQKENEWFLYPFNNTLSTGYFVTHSARMALEGELGFGCSYAHPYTNINGRIQPFSFLELGYNYRIFQNCPDPNFISRGFGNYADRGANFKVALVTPEQSFYRFPGVAFGIDDFLGSKKFTTYFIVGTQVFPDYGLEASFGWGAGRYTHGPSRGFFGAVNFLPFWNCNNQWIRTFSLSAEYDPTNYKNPHTEPHPDGRKSNSPINFGAKYTVKNFLDISAGYIRGSEFSVAGSVKCNFAKMDGFFPKIRDPDFYMSPRDNEPLGCERPASVMVQQLSYALQTQGFLLTKAWVDCSTLYIRVINQCYRQEHIVKMRLQKLLATLIPENVENVVVQTEFFGLPCQQYVFRAFALKRYLEHKISEYEFEIISQRGEVEIKPPGEFLFNRSYTLFNCRPEPRWENFFGSSKGKYKYDLGVRLSMDGMLPKACLYEWQLSETLFSNIGDMGDFDVLFPSQLPCVATDYVRYRQSHALSWDKLYLQKNWNCTRGLFCRLAAGYFQINYAGVAGEALFYPADSLFAIGVESAVVKKRRYQGLGFQSKIRHLEGYTPVYSDYTVLLQYFLTLYVDIPEMRLFSRVSLGQFLARDKGIRVDICRYFNNGMRFYGWMTFTNAGDKIHGENYYDKGVALEIPLDFFYLKSCRKVWTHAAAAWLRDAGYATTTGHSLFEIINQERRW